MEKDKQKQAALDLIFYTVILMISTLLITVFVLRQYGEWVSFTWFMNGDRAFSVRVLLLSMVSAIVFGFIDNAGLSFGMSALDPYLPGGDIEKAGWGNTYSDGVGAFMGAFIAKMIGVMSGFDGQGPIYGDFIGVIIGCILGIYIPKYIKGTQ
jgi:hypothetical protein